MWRGSGSPTRRHFSPRDGRGDRGPRLRERPRLDTVPRSRRRAVWAADHPPPRRGRNACRATLQRSAYLESPFAGMAPRDRDSLRCAPGSTRGRVAPLGGGPTGHPEAIRDGRTPVESNGGRSPVCRSCGAAARLARLRLRSASEAAPFFLMRRSRISKEPSSCSTASSALSPRSYLHFLISCRFRCRRGSRVVEPPQSRPLDPSACIRVR